MKFLLALISAAVAQKCEANLAVYGELECKGAATDVALSYDKGKCGELKYKGASVGFLKVTKCEGATWIQELYDTSKKDCAGAAVPGGTGTIAKDACKKMGAKTSGKLTRIGAAPKKDDGKKDDAAKKGDDKKAGAAKLMVGSAIAATLLAM